MRTRNGEPDFYLGSEELTAWSVPRAVYLLASGERGAYRVRLDPAAPDGTAEVVVRPRYEGDALEPSGELPLHVTVFDDRGALVARGELYATQAEAAATTGGIGGVG
jgi:hypothetical protein